MKYVPVELDRSMTFGFESITLLKIKNQRLVGSFFSLLVFVVSMMLERTKRNDKQEDKAEAN